MLKRTLISVSSFDRFVSDSSSWLFCLHDWPNVSRKIDFVYMSTLTGRRPAEDRTETPLTSDEGTSPMAKTISQPPNS
jgi:hypothetical protein